MGTRAWVVLGIALVAVCGVGAPPAEGGRSNGTAPPSTVAQASTSPSLPAGDVAEAERLGTLIAAADDGSVEAAIEALARAGVAVYSDDTSSILRPIEAPQSPLRLLRFQVAGLVAQRTASIDLNTLTTTSEPIPLAHLLAGYVANGQTFGAELSRVLMSGQGLRRPSMLVFPGLTLVIFTADVLTPQSASGSLPGNRAALNAWLAPVGSGSGFCADLQAFLNDTLSALSDAAQAITNEVPVLGPILSFAGDLLGLGAEAIVELTGSAAFIDGFKKAAAIVGILVVAVSAMQPWQVEVDPSEPFPHHAISGEAPVTGRFTATVATSGDPFDVIRPCAEIAGIQLPDAETAVGAPVTWAAIQGIGEHLLEVGRDDVVAANGTAAFDYELQDELASVHSYGSEQTAVAQVRATVTRAGPDLIAQLADAVFGTGLLGGVIGDLLGPTLIADADAALNKILALADPQGVGTALVSYHVAQPAHFTWLYQVPTSMTTLTGESCNGLEGPWQVTVVTVASPSIGGGGGTGTGTFTLPGGDQPGHLLVNVPITLTAIDVTGIHIYDMTVTVSAGEPVTLVFDGTLTAATAFGDYTEEATITGAVTFGGQCANQP